MLFENDPEGISEVVNDIDSELFCFWCTLRTGDLFKMFCRVIEAMPFSEDSYRSAVAKYGIIGNQKATMIEQTYPHIVERAVEFFVRNRQSRQALEKDFATVTRNRTRRGMNEQVSSWLSAIDGLPWFHERLKRVLILNRPALDVIKQQDGHRTLFYLDPCYLPETRSAKKAYGEHEMACADHCLLLALLSSEGIGDIPPEVLPDIDEKQLADLLDFKLKSRFVLSGYRSNLYDATAKLNGWRRDEIQVDNKASSAKDKELKNEVVWMNF